ncbi:JmjC domain-containing protein [Streptomyces sp. CA-288835]|uniref:JmjC domain-containing protein n=1 Tax=Streptomyces sp. CA-288835 TaxID=3240069 RepID=UPI003D8F2AA8
MSLHLLLPEDGVTELLGSWPDEPSVYERGATELDQLVTPDFFETWAFSGCTPAPEVAVMNLGGNPPRPSINPIGFMTNGRTDGAKLRRYYEQGFTIRLGNLQRVIPAIHEVSRKIQTETGYSNYLHAFLTPPGGQGLRHHWDQQMAVIVQISGTKTWELWQPKFRDPVRDHLDSTKVWDVRWQQEWIEKGPDQVYDLRAGQSMILPRGWVHNPHSLTADEPSVHLTFAIRERTPIWLVDQLISGVIRDEEFRTVLLPAEIHGEALRERLRETRRDLIEYLEALDMDEKAESVRERALTELEYTT